MERHNDRHNDQLDGLDYEELKRELQGDDEPGHAQDCAWCGKPLEGGVVTRLGYVHRRCKPCV